MKLEKESGGPVQGSGKVMHVHVGESGNCRLQWHCSARGSHRIRLAGAVNISFF